MRKYAEKFEFRDFTRTKEKATFLENDNICLCANHHCRIFSIIESGDFMKQDDTFIPDALAFKDLRNRGLVRVGVARTKRGLEYLRKEKPMIFEPRLNYGVREYREICKRRQRFFK